MPLTPENPSPDLMGGEPFNPRWESCKFFPCDAVNRQKDLSPAAKLLYARLLKFVNKQGVCWSTQGVLARELARSERQTRRDLEALAGAGFIRWRVRGCGRARSTRTFYEFLWHRSFVDDLYDRTLTSVRNEVTTGQTEPYDRTPVVPTTGHTCPPTLEELQELQEASGSFHSQRQPAAPQPSGSTELKQPPPQDQETNPEDEDLTPPPSLDHAKTLPWLQLALWKFVGKKWPEPDRAICLEIIGIARQHGATPGDIWAVLIGEWKEGKRPEKNYAWFKPVVRDKLERRSQPVNGHRRQCGSDPQPVTRELVERVLGGRSLAGVPGAALVVVPRMAAHCAGGSTTGQVGRMASGGP